MSDIIECLTRITVSLGVSICLVVCWPFRTTVLRQKQNRLEQIPFYPLKAPTPLLFVHFRVHPRRWSEEEDELLRMAVEKHDGVS